MPRLRNLDGFCEWSVKLATLFVLWPCFLVMEICDLQELLDMFRSAVLRPAVRWLKVPSPNVNRK